MFAAPHGYRLADGGGHRMRRPGWCHYRVTAHTGECRPEAVLVRFSLWRNGIHGAGWFGRICRCQLQYRIVARLERSYAVGARASWQTLGQGAHFGHGRRLLPDSLGGEGVRYEMSASLGVELAASTKAMKLLNIFKPIDWLFSGWNCVAYTLALCTMAQKGPP